MANHSFLFETEAVDRAIADQFVSAMTAESIDPVRCSSLGEQVLSVVTDSLAQATDDEILRYAVRGRGADFVALNLLYDPKADDFLRLHVYPRDTSDGGYHRHSRRVVSNLVRGQIENYEAFAEICEPNKGNPELEVWDCKIIEGRCTPAPNKDIAARLTEKGNFTVKGQETYTVPSEIYHTVGVEAGTATLCLFTRAGMCEEVSDGRLIKPARTPLEPILSMDADSIRDIRQAIL